MLAASLRLWLLSQNVVFLLCTELSLRRLQYVHFPPSGEVLLRTFPILELGFVAVQRLAVYSFHRLKVGSPRIGRHPVLSWLSRVQCRGARFRGGMFHRPLRQQRVGSQSLREESPTS